MVAGKRLAAWIVGGLLLGPSPAPAADEAAVQRAVARGIAFLKDRQGANGTWSYPDTPVGATALAGLTLLECDVPADDPAVQKAAAVLRREAVGLTHTYSLSLAVLFLDRLGEPRDRVLIQAMAVRLLAGQGASGGWSYECPPPGREEVGRLTDLLHKHKDPEDTAIPPSADSGDPPALPPEARRQLKQINPKARPALGDNSNTKFATLALWTARRHGIPVAEALALAEARFRQSQRPDGGWGYIPNPPGGNDQSFASMTCAGLLGLAAGLASEPVGGRASERKGRLGASDAGADPVLRAGFQALATVIGEPLDGPRPGRMALFNPKGDEYYFLWALERVAVAYGLGTIGKKDWYGWGADWLLARQRRDGSWHGAYGDSVDTCFALLFLRRANLARDLTARLKERVGHPGEIALKSREAPEKDERKDSGARPRPPADDAEAKAFAAEVGRLTRALVQAPQSRQADLLETYKDAKGAAYTDALAAAIPQLRDKRQAEARTALVERLAQGSAATLRARLGDKDVEVRRAAAGACARRQDPESIPSLIPLLEDDEPAVVQAAHAALVALAGGADFGPGDNATRSERKAAAAAWKGWWAGRTGK